MRTIGSALDLFVLTFQHIRELQVFVALARQPKEGDILLDGLPCPVPQARIQISLGLDEIAPVVELPEFLQAVIAMLPGQMIERVPGRSACRSAAMRLRK